MTQIFKGGNSYVIRCNDNKVIRTRNLSQHDKLKIKNMNTLSEIEDYLLRNNYVIKFVDDII